MSDSVCPLEEGDRIDHRMFGMGTVAGAPVAVVGADPRHGLCDAGWAVPVQWDDPNRTAARVMHHALRKVSLPESRPFTYWDRQWQPLVDAWLGARRAVEQLQLCFRPLPDVDDVAQAQQREVEAYQAMQDFLADEQGGRHP